MALRNYVNTSKEAALSLPIGTGDTTIALTPPGLVNVPAIPFYVRLDPDTASEELILVGSGTSALTLMNCTRGFDGTTAFTHNAGAKARHCVAAEFYNKADAHVEASTNVHGLSGGAAVVGTTQTQTITNKTLNASIVDVAHTTSPAASQAVKVSADSAAGRDGFVWDNTGGSAGRSVVVRAGGVDRFVVTGVGLVVSNSATGTDKAISVQNSAVERLFIQADGHTDFALQAGGATVDRVRIRTQSTQNALAVKDSGGFNIFTIGGSGNVDASGYIATATNLSATGSITAGTTAAIGTNATVGGTLAVTGATTLTGPTTMPLPAAGTTQRLIARSRTGGTNFEGQNQAGTGTFYVRETGEIGASGKAFIHDSLSPVVAEVTGTGVVPSPATNMVVFDGSDRMIKRYNGATWDTVGDWRANTEGLAKYYRTANQTNAVVANTWTRQAFNVSLSTTADVSPNGSFDQFTLNRAGVYRIVTQVRPLTTSTTTHRYILGIFPGSTPGTGAYAQRTVIEPDATANSTNIGVEVERRFAASDVICVALYRTPYGGAGNGTNSDTEALAENCHISIMWVRS